MFARPRSVLCWALWAGLLLVLLPGSASALTQATSSVDLACDDGALPSVIVHESGPTPLAESCEDSVDFGVSGARSSSAAASTTFAASPTTSATADAGVTGVPGGAVSSTAVSTIGYQLQVIEIAPPPMGGITGVPVTLAASGSVSASVPSAFWNAIGESFVMLSGEGVAVIEGASDASDGSATYPSNFFNSVVAIPNIMLGSAYTLVVFAQCRADASSNVSVSTVLTAHCQADTSIGSISFDQAAFDVLMGASTFPLANFYAFDVSSNLIVPVPALGRGALLLLVLGVAALGIASTSRKLRA